ncbi:cytochrome c-type biogenesis protein CcmH [Paraperlucidibaca baekdonensis]|uniref:Cytochrome c-type biogenesis protein n=1 Tax=Paraperlucidibaca baekdonensis TaxID=748120 RepID=A0A3E0H5N1_9GAMM|nr:cytochrome c-type biogenesis protein [Paraperlucidibaca baekdonensis]REH37910.1 cytochrome c-type biogenesis protein CcmH [Paraperlucidibaca baekdonensis]
MKYALMMLLAVFSAGAQAAIDVRDFDTPLQETRYRALIDELRCPKCQNTNLAGSDAGLAGDLKDRVYEQVKAGQSDGEIRDYLITRYGDFITYKPPMRASTYVLWFGPFVLLLVAGFIMWRRTRGVVAKSKPLSAQEAEQLQRVLSEERRG